MRTGEREGKGERMRSVWEGKRACDEGRACVGWGGGEAKAREACRVWELDGLYRGGDLH